MNKTILKELRCLQGQIEELVTDERFGANYKDYPPNINQFEKLVYSFYEIASNQEMPIDILQCVLDGKGSLNRNFMFLRGKTCTNKFEKMRLIYSEINQIMNGLIEFEHQK